MQQQITSQYLNLLANNNLSQALNQASTLAQSLNQGEESFRDVFKSFEDAFSNVCDELDNSTENEANEVGEPALTTEPEEIARQEETPRAEQEPAAETIKEKPPAHEAARAQTEARQRATTEESAPVEEPRTAEQSADRAQAAGEQTGTEGTAETEESGQTEQTSKVAQTDESAKTEENLSETAEEAPRELEEIMNAILELLAQIKESVSAPEGETDTSALAQQLCALKENVQDLVAAVVSLFESGDTEQIKSAIGKLINLVSENKGLSLENGLTQESADGTQPTQTKTAVQAAGGAQESETGTEKNRQSASASARQSLQSASQSAETPATAQSAETTDTSSESPARTQNASAAAKESTSAQTTTRSAATQTAATPAAAQGGEQIQEILSRLGESLEEIKDGFSKVLESFGGADSAVTAVSSALGTDSLGTDSLQAALQAAVAPFIENISGSEQEAKSMFENLLKTVGEQINKITQEIKQIFGAGQTATSTGSNQQESSGTAGSQIHAQALASPQKESAQTTSTTQTQSAQQSFRSSFNEYNSVQRVSSALRTAVSQGKMEASLRLDPPELGKMSVKLSIEGDKVVAHMQVDNESAKSMIERNLSQLKTALAAQGLSVEEFNISLSDSGREDQNRGSSLASQLAASRGYNTGTMQDTEDEDSAPLVPQTADTAVGRVNVLI